MRVILFSRKGSNLLRRDSENELSSKFTKLYREPKCARCRIHGVISDSKGHKYICEYRRCACQKCRHVAEKQRVTAKRVANLREKRKRIQDASPFLSGASKISDYSLQNKDFENGLIQDDSPLLKGTNKTSDYKLPKKEFENGLIQDASPLLRGASKISNYKLPNKEFENRLDQGCKDFNFQYKELYEIGQNDSFQKMIPSEEVKHITSNYDQKQKKLANQYQFPQFHQPQKPDHMTQYNPCEERFVFQNKLVEKPYNRRNCEFTIQSILKRNEPYPNIIDNFSQVNYLIRYDIAWLEYKFPYLPANDIITALSKANGNLPLALMILLES